MNAKQQMVLVRNWNRKHAAGAPVKVRQDDGAELKTTTTSEAWLLGGHSAVVKLQGVSGAYALARVSAI